MINPKVMSASREAIFKDESDKAIKKWPKWALESLISDLKFRRHLNGREDEAKLAVAIEALRLMKVKAMLRYTRGRKL